MNLDDLCLLVLEPTVGLGLKELDEVQSLENGHVKTQRFFFLSKILLQYF